MTSLKSLTLAAIFYASFNPSATAHCFSVWHYKFAQKCQFWKKEKPIFVENRDWFVEFILPDERDQAIDKLKEKLKEQ